MKAKTLTGGRVEFVYDGKEELEDTKPTEEFKEAYKKWMKKPKWKRFLLRLFRIVK